MVRRESLHPSAPSLMTTRNPSAKPSWTATTFAVYNRCPRTSLFPSVACTMPKSDHFGLFHSTSGTETTECVDNWVKAFTDCKMHIVLCTIGTVLSQNTKRMLLYNHEGKVPYTLNNTEKFHSNMREIWHPKITLDSCVSPSRFFGIKMMCTGAWGLMSRNANT